MKIVLLDINIDQDIRNRNLHITLFLASVFSVQLFTSSDRPADTHTHTDSRQAEEGALMEAEEQIYANIEELGECHTKQKQPQHTGTKSVRTASVARGETETCSSFKVATVCLALLCFLLLMTVVGVGVQYGRDFNQLSRDLAIHTAEKDQLLARYQNLTDERDQLQSSLNSALFELSNMKKNIGTCPQGWRHSGSSCYFFYTTRSTWDNSRYECLSKQADLVIIDSQGEMEFLNNLGAHSKFWIGLRKTSTQSNWMWTDNRPLRTAYWQNGYATMNYYRTQSCAAFNSFNTLWGTIKSWSSEVCSQLLQAVCERQPEMSFQPW